MSSQNPPKMFIFGLGYVGQHLSRALVSAGWRVSGTVRGSESSAAKSGEFSALHHWSEGLSTQSLREDVLSSDAVLISIPTHQEEGALSREWSQWGSQSGGQPKWLGYLSSTGVYGDHQGRWVDEATPCQPNSATAEARLRAEVEWAKQGAHIFRLAGIYGPERSVLGRVASGSARRIDKPGQFFSRTHVEDIVRVLRASMDFPSPATIYNVADDEPASSRDVIEYACELLGAPLPPLEDYGSADLSPGARRFYESNRRVRSDRAKRLVGQWQYPTFRQGLKSLLPSSESQ